MKVALLWQEVFAGEEVMMLGFSEFEELILVFPSDWQGME